MTRSKLERRLAWIEWGYKGYFIEKKGLLGLRELGESLFLQTHLRRREDTPIGIVFS
jgi:hypothetical protein